MRIGINCGHTVSGQPGCGAVGFVDESVETRNVGKKLMSLLKQAGHTVVGCTNDYAPTTSSNLSQIVGLANRQPLDLFVSIHFNSGGGHGAEVWTYGGEQHAEAVNVCKALNKLGFVNRGIKDGSHLYVVRRSDAKAILIEVCFVDTDDAKLYREIGADRIAQAICMAITGQEVNNEEDIDMTKAEEFEKRISALEQNVNKPEMIYNYVDNNMPEWAREAVQWLMDKGILAGTGDGLNLNDMKLWTCVMLYRVIKFVTKLINVKI